MKRISERLVFNANLSDSKRTASLQRDWHHHLEGDIAPHIINATTTCHHVLIGILQATQVVLIGLIQQIVGCDIQFGNLLTPYLHIGTSREREQGIAWGDGFSIIGTIDMRLLQVTVKAPTSIPMTNWGLA